MITRQMSLPAPATINSLMGADAVRCRGLPCEEWKIMQEELAKLKASSQLDEDKVSTELIKIIILTIRHV